MNVNELHQTNIDVSAKSLFHGQMGLASSIQLQKEAVLKEHITKTPALLICILGQVSYQDEKGQIIELGAGDYVNIVPDLKHWIVGHMNSQLILLK